MSLSMDPRRGKTKHLTYIKSIDSDSDTFIEIQKRYALPIQEQKILQ